MLGAVGIRVGHTETEPRWVQGRQENRGNSHGSTLVTVENTVELTLQMASRCLTQLSSADDFII